jgi:hypothetical protein
VKGQMSLAPPRYRRRPEGGKDERVHVVCPVTRVWPDYDSLVERPVSVPERIASVVLRDRAHLSIWGSPTALAEDPCWR